MINGSALYESTGIEIRFYIKFFCLKKKPNDKHPFKSPKKMYKQNFSSISKQNDAPAPQIYNVYIYIYISQGQGDGPEAEVTLVKTRTP